MVVDTERNFVAGIVEILVCCIHVKGRDKERESEIKTWIS